MLTAIRSGTGEDTDWLRMALTAVVAVEASDVVCRGGEGWAASPIRRKGGATHPQRYGPHGHPFAEICIALAGQAVFDFEQQRYCFTTPAMAIVPPHAVHCEACRQRNWAYALLWMNFSGPALMASVSAYQPERGWYFPQKWTLRSRSVRRLFDRFMAAREAMSEDAIEPIRADLIATMGELYENTFYGRNRQPGAGTDDTQRHATLLKNVQTFIENHLDEPLSLQEIASLARMSPNYLNRLFAEQTGESIRKYLIRCRMEKAIQLWRETDLLVKQIAPLVGYDDPLYFSRAFFKYHGQWPSDVQRG